MKGGDRWAGKKLMTPEQVIEYKKEQEKEKNFFRAWMRKTTLVLMLLHFLFGVCRFMFSGGLLGTVIYR